MKRIIAVTAVAVSLAAGSFAGGTWWAHRSGAAHASAHAATVYTCPMHPDYRSDHPGNCPICGMPLEAVRAGAATGGDAAARALPHGAVQVSPERQQAIGVRLGVVSRLAGTRLLRTTGRVAPDENRTYPIVAAVSGWIRNVESVDDGRRREEGPGARVVPRARGRVQECAAVVLHRPRGVLPHGGHAAAAAAAVAVARLRARRRGDRPDGRRAADPGRLQLAAQGDGQAPRARAGHPRGVAGGRRRAEAQRLARPPVRSRLRVLPDRGSEPRVDSGRRVPPPAAVHPPRRLRADHHGGREPRAVGDGEPVGADLRRGDADAEGAARGGEPAAGAQARHVRRRGVPGRPPGGARRAGGCDRGLGAAQDGVRRPRQRILRAAAGRDGVARRRRRRGDERAHAWRADRDLGHLLRRFREPHEGSHAHEASAAPVLDPVCGMHVDPREAGNAGRTAAHGEHVFFFCSDNCKQQFVADPSRHAKPTVAKP